MRARKPRVLVARGQHNKLPRKGRPLRLIARFIPGKRRNFVLLGAEGWKPRRGGWYIVARIRLPRLPVDEILTPIVVLAHRRNRVSL